MSSADFWVGPLSAAQTYRLVSLLGGGGEGEVWRAEIPLSTGGRRQVAVKILPSSGRPDEISQWERFGHLLKSLSHPGIVRVTDVFTGAGPHRMDEPARDLAPYRYVVMDHIEGPTLREWCDENPDATASTRLRMLRMIASALDEMHSGATTQIPVAHGDIKPSNVIVRPDGGTVLVDLGLARLTDGAGVAGHSAPYTAPELRVPGALATPEADSYAFATTTAQVLLGKSPPTGPDEWLDLAALECLLRSQPITQRRQALIKQILDVLTAPPEARPRHLRLWLDATCDAISLITSSEPTGLRAPAASAGDSTEDYPTRSDTPMTPAATPPADAPRRRRRRPLGVLTAILILLLAGGIGYLYLTRASSSPLASATTAGIPTPASQNTPPTTPAETASGSPSASPTALVGPQVSKGTQLATYSFDLPEGFSAPLGVDQPTRSQFDPADGGDIVYSANYSNLGPGHNEQVLDLGGAPPTYQACAADTLIETAASPRSGTTFCVVETGQRMAGVTVTSVGATQAGNSYATLDVTLWQNSQP